MPLTLTSRNSASAFVGSLSLTSGSFTPSDNSLLFAIGGYRNGSTSSLIDGWTISNSGTALTWTRQYSRSTVVGARSYVIIVYTAPVTSHASMTVTLANSETPSNAGTNLHVFDVTGYNPVTPTKNRADDDVLGNGAYTLTLPSAPSSGSIVVGCRVYEDNGSFAVSATPGSDFTEIYDTNADPGGWAGLETQYRANSTSTSVSWVDVADDASATELAGISLAFEMPLPSVANIAWMRA